MEMKQLIILCLIAAAAFLLAIKYGFLQCPKIKGLGIDDKDDFGGVHSVKDDFGGFHSVKDDFEAVTPNACVDMMELGFGENAVNACVAYSNKCDAKDDIWHSPVVAAEVNNLYAKLGRDAAKSPAFVTAFEKDACVNPIACSSDADCPSFLRCGDMGGGGSACQ